MNAFSLAGSTALVTGSTQGIGLGIAQGLLAAGASVVFHGNAARPAGLPDGSAFLPGDLLEPGAPAALVGAAFGAAPGLDLLVCNAGTFCDVPFLEMDQARWDRTMNLNARAAYFVVQAFARGLAARKRPGAVVIVSSTNGFQSEEDSTAYDASKGAVVMMTRTLAQALAPHAIRVNGVAPGLIHTPLTAPSLDASPDRRRHYERKIWLGRIGTPADCAGAAVFLLSQAAAYVTGQVVVVDGGLTSGQIGRM
jgi:NAD(P)-dependent dehydrogenase (short-subunit alcohol dehydrogenase family)